MLTQPTNCGFRGLTREQAVARFTTDGPNELPSAKPRRFLVIAWEVLREPMILLLVAAGVIYLVLGEPHDSLVLLLSIFAILGIDLYQQNKTEHALEALRDLSSPRATGAIVYEQTALNIETVEQITDERIGIAWRSGRPGRGTVRRGFIVAADRRGRVELMVDRSKGGQVK